MPHLFKIATALSKHLSVQCMQDIDICSKEFIFIPVHQGFHWTLIVICYPSSADTGQRRKVLHLDSLLGVECSAEMLLSCPVASLAC